MGMSAILGPTPQTRDYLADSLLPLQNGFHATTNSAGSCGGDRYTLAQPVNFDANGNPDLGTPVAKGTQINVPSGDGS